MSHHASVSSVPRRDWKGRQGVGHEGRAHCLGWGGQEGPLWKWYCNWVLSEVAGREVHQCSQGGEGGRQLQAWLPPWAWSQQGLAGSRNTTVVEPQGSGGSSEGSWLEDRQLPSLQDRGTSEELCADLRALEGKGAGGTGSYLGFYSILLGATWCIRDQGCFQVNHAGGCRTGLAKSWWWLGPDWWWWRWKLSPTSDDKIYWAWQVAVA